MARIPARPICGHPVKYYEIASRPLREDTEPVCHRPPHEGDRHMSQASYENELERSRANRWRYARGGRS